MRSVSSPVPGAAGVEVSPASLVSRVTVLVVTSVVSMVVPASSRSSVVVAPVFLPGGTNSQGPSSSDGQLLRIHFVEELLDRVQAGGGESDEAVPVDLLPVGPVNDSSLLHLAVFRKVLLEKNN